jgi:hypothetical protein
MNKSDGQNNNTNSNNKNKNNANGNRSNSNDGEAHAVNLERVTTGRIAGMGPKIIEALSAADKLMFLQDGAYAGKGAGKDMHPPILYAAKSQSSKHMLGKVTKLLYSMSNNSYSSY